MLFGILIDRLLFLAIEWYNLHTLPKLPTHKWGSMWTMKDLRPVSRGTPSMIQCGDGGDGV